MGRLTIAIALILLQVSIYAQHQPKDFFIPDHFPFGSSLKKVTEKDSLDIVRNELNALKSEIKKYPQWMPQPDSLAKWKLLYYENFGWSRVSDAGNQRVEHDFKYINGDPQTTFTIKQIYEVFRPEVPESPNMGWSITEFGEKYLVVEAEWYNQPRNAPNWIINKIYYFRKID